MRKFRLLSLLAVAFLMTAGGFASAEQNDALSVGGAAVSGGKSTECVEPVPVMRREHMDFLLRQRDETMHQGIRSGNYSLVGCVDCHEDLKRDNQGRLVPSDIPISVNDPENGFCQMCHQYAAVNIDCFQCHVVTSDTGK